MRNEGYRMTIEYLIYFQKIARGETFLNVAEEYNISQSSLSKMIRSLEYELGIELFDRSHRKVKLTPQGEILNRDIADVLTAYNNMMSHINRNKTTISCYIRPSISVLNLRYIVEQFMVKYPWISITLRDDRNPANISRLLKEHEIDYVITHRPPRDFADCKEIILTDDWPVVLLPSDHILASEQEVDISLLEGEAFALIMRNSNMVEKTYDLLSLPTPATIMTSMNREELLWHIRKEKHPSIMYASDILSFNLHGVVARRIKGLQNQPYIMATPNLNEPNKDNMLFLNYLIENVTVLSDL